MFNVMRLKKESGLGGGRGTMTISHLITYIMGKNGLLFIRPNLFYVAMGISWFCIIIYE